MIARRARESGIPASKGQARPRPISRFVNRWMKVDNKGTSRRSGRLIEGNERMVAR